ncbi:hypothetical protein IWX92DRAFT_420294 [Phyllosticta citricarpa]
MPLHKPPPSSSNKIHLKQNPKAAASEADLVRPASLTPPQTILPSPSKKSSTRSFRPSRYFHRRPSSNTDAMDLSRPKIPVTITFFHPNTSPPVFVATSLTNPPWQVVEMDVKQERTPSGDLIFEKKFDAVEAGEYQYKFRLGPGDWWVCDDNAPTVSDGFGNSNNLLIVEPKDPLAEQGADADQEGAVLERVESAPEVWSRGTKQQLSQDRKPGKESDPEPQSRSTSPVPAVVVEKVDDAPSHGDDFGPGATSGQQLAHKKRKADADPNMVVVSAESDGKGPASMHPDSAAAVGHDALIEHTPADDNVPLLPHESISPDAPQQAPLFPHEAAVAVSSGSSNCTEDDEDDAAGPETFQPVDFKGDIPLFRHESIALPPGEGGSGSEHKPPPSLQNMMDQEDPNDPSLVPFPTKRETIYEHIRSLEHRLEEDQSIPEESTSNSPSSQAVAEEPAPPSPLDSIQEDHEEEEDPANVASLNVQRDGQAERHHHARTVGSVPTPPLTPTSESASKKHERADSVFAIPADNIGARIEASQTVYEDSRSKPISGDDDQQHKVVASSPKGAPSDKRRQGALIAIWNTLFGSWLGPIGRWFSSLCGGRGRAT